MSSNQNGGPMTHLASIIIATYNREHCIVNAIDSVLKTINDYNAPIEVIIADDCSTDNTENSLKEKYKEEIANGSINYFKLPVNKGVSGARNAGVMRAKGEWVIFFDSDDTLTIDSGRNISKELQNNSQVPVIFFRCIDQDGNRVGTNFSKENQLINLKDFLRFGSRGECLVAIKKEAAINFPFNEMLRGYEGLTIAMILKSYKKPALLSSSIVRKYIQTSNDRLSSKSGLSPRMHLIGKGHWLMAKGFYRDMPIGLSISYILKSLVYKIWHVKFRIFN